MGQSKPFSKIVAGIFACALAMIFLTVTGRAASGYFLCGNSGPLYLVNNEGRIPQGWDWIASSSTLALNNNKTIDNSFGFFCSPTDVINVEILNDVATITVNLDEYNYSFGGGGNAIACEGSLKITPTSPNNKLIVEGQDTTNISAADTGGYGILARNDRITIGAQTSATGGNGSKFGGIGVCASNGSIYINAPTTAIGGFGPEAGGFGIYAKNGVIFNDSSAKLTVKDGAPVEPDSTYILTMDNVLTVSGTHVWDISGAPNAAYGPNGTLVVTRSATEYTIGLKTAPNDPDIITNSLPGGTVGVSYNAFLIADRAVTWSIDNMTAFPDGLSLNASTGEITGTPTTAGTYNFDVKAAGANGSATKTISLTIADPYSGQSTSSDSSDSSDDNWKPPAPQKPVAPKTAFPAKGKVTANRIGVYKLETLKTRQFYLARGNEFTLLGLANGGRAFEIEHGGRRGFISIDGGIEATFGVPLRGTALKKASGYVLLENGKYDRIGSYPKGHSLLIHGISDNYLISEQRIGTFYLNAAQWGLLLGATGGE